MRPADRRARLALGAAAAVAALGLAGCPSSSSGGGTRRTPRTVAFDPSVVVNDDLAGSADRDTGSKNGRRNVAVAGDRVFAVFEDDRNGSGSVEVLLARSDDGGATFGSNVVVAPTDFVIRAAIPSGGDALDPAITVASGGLFGGFLNDAYTVEVVTGGPLDGTAQVRITSELGDDVAALQPVFDGIAIALGGNGATITFTSVDPLAQLVADQTFSIVVKRPDQKAPAVVVGPDGDDVFVAWSEDADGLGPRVLVATSPNAGVSFDPPVLVDDAVDVGQKRPSLALDEAGVLTVVFGASDIFLDRSVDGGNTFGADIPVSGAAVASFLFDFEDGLPAGWQADGAVWEVGAPTAGPGFAFSGENVFATILDADYPNDVGPDEGDLTTQSFDLSGFSEVRLAFRHNFTIENNFDGGRVQVSTTGANGVFLDVTPDGGYPGNLVGNGAGVFTGGPFPAADAYALAVFDLTALAAGAADVVIRFRFESDGSVTDEGWFVDDVSLVASNGSFAFENPSVAVAPTGPIFVAAERRDVGRVVNDVVVFRSDDGGATFEAPIIANDLDPEALRSDPTLVVLDDAGERLLLAWADTRFDVDGRGARDVFVARSDDGGASFSDDLQVNDADSLRSDEGGPSLALAGNGVVGIAWDGEVIDTSNPEGLTPFFDSSRDGGVTFGPDVAVTDAVPGQADARGASLGMLDDGTPVVVWAEDRVSLVRGRDDVRAALGTNIAPAAVDADDVDATVVAGGDDVTFLLERLPIQVTGAAPIPAAVTATGRFVTARIDPVDFDVLVTSGGALDGTAVVDVTAVERGTLIPVEDANIVANNVVGAPVISGDPVVLTDDGAGEAAIVFDDLGLDAELVAGQRFRVRTVDGFAVAGQLDPGTDELLFAIELPRDALSLSIVLAGPAGSDDALENNLDLAVRLGAPPVVRFGSTGVQGDLVADDASEAQGTTIEEVTLSAVGPAPVDDLNEAVLAAGETAFVLVQRGVGVVGEVDFTLTIGVDDAATAGGGNAELGLGASFGPRVVRNAPTDGDDEADPLLTERIEVGFDRFLDPDDVVAPGSVELLRLPDLIPVAANVELDQARRSILVTPLDDPLTPDLYRVVVDGSVRDVLGRRLGQAAVSDFATRPFRVHIDEGFEDGAPAGFIVVGGVFEFGAPTSGPGRAFEGNAVLATVLDADYPNDADVFVLLPTVDLTDARTAVLSFFHNFDIEFGFDGARVEVSTTGAGGPFVVLEPIVPDGYPAFADDGQPAFGNVFGQPFPAETEYAEAVFDLTSLAGNAEVSVRLVFKSDGSVTAPGWFIDRLRLESTQ